MEPSLSTLLVLCAVFLAAGLVDSIAGGGGLITCPSLLLFGLPPHAALGTGKFASTLGSLSALWTYARNNMVVMRIAPAGFCASFIGSACGAGLAMLLDSAVLGKVIVFLLPVGLAVSLFSGRSFGAEGALPEKRLMLRVVPMGFLIGAYDGFFGPGTGSFFIIAQSLFLHLGLVRASATAKVFNMASNFGAMLVFASGGVVWYATAVPLAVANIIGNQIGTRLALRIGPSVVRFFLYATLSILLATLVHRFFVA